jgi:preprotein translocase subunit SecE
MARDRKRAKERKARREQARGRPDALPEGDHIHRENVSGELEHLGEVDQFEARLVAGAEGQPADADEAALAEEATAEGTISPVSSDRDTRGGLARFPGFLRASWSELQRVQWPDRRQIGQATAVVLGFCLLAGAFLGIADVVASRLIDLII